MEKSIVKENREFWLVYLLSIVTCGIYGLYFMWHVVKDLNTICRTKEYDTTEDSPNYLLVVVFSLLTCGVYGIYWFYKTANRMKHAGERYGVRIDEDGRTYLLYLIASFVVSSVVSQSLSLITWIPILGTIVNHLVSTFITLVTSGVLLYVFIENLNKLCKAYCNGALPDQVIPVGEYASNQDVRTTALPEGKVVGASGMFKGESIDVKDNKELVIGRDAAVSNLVIEDSGVSRKHCAICFNSMERNYYVKDFSTNGVFLGDGRKLTKNMNERVAPGSIIRLGQTDQIFLLK